MKELNDIIVQLMNIDGEIYENPDELSKGLIVLSAHLYQIGARITEAECKYAGKWTAERIKYQSDKACEMALKMSEEYREMEARKNAQKMTIEIIRSIKKRLSVLSDEAKTIY